MKSRKSLPLLPITVENDLEFEAVEALSAAINALSEDERQVILSFYFKPQTIYEVAAELDLSKRTINRLLRSARQKIFAKVTRR